MRPIARAGRATDGVEGNPVLTEDELTIYFKRAPKNHQGPSNVFRATRASIAHPFEFPNQLTELNTFTDDAPGWISADECTIVIVSKKGGTSDLLIAHRTK